MQMVKEFISLVYFIFFWKLHANLRLSL